MSFEFRKEYLEALSLFDDKVMRLALYDTICNFGINGEDTDLAGYELTQRRRDIVRMVARPIIYSISYSWKPGRVAVWKAGRR